MKILRSVQLTILFSALFAAGLWGQTYKFRNLLPDAYIYSITQDRNGFLWVGGGKETGLLKFDGFDFYPVTFPDSSLERYVTISLRDRNGRIWLGCNDGTLFYSVPNGLAQIPDAGIQIVNDMFEGPDGSVWVIPQDRMILKIDEENPGKITKFGVARDLIMSSASLTPAGNIIIGTQENLILCSFKGDSVITDKVVPGIEYVKVQAIRQIKKSQNWLIGTEGSGLYTLSLSGTTTSLKRFRGHPELETLDIRSILADSSGNYWLSAYNTGAIQFSLASDNETITSYREMTTASGLVSQNIRTIFQDMEGNIWMGFYGEGLSMMYSDAFTYYQPSDNPDANNIIYISGTKDRYFLGTPRGYYFFNISKGKADPLVNTFSETGVEISSYLYEKDGTIWVGLKGSGLYCKRPGAQFRIIHRSGNTAEDYIKNISIVNNRIWLATLNGIVILDKSTGEVVEKLGVEDRLPHNSINQLFVRSTGTIIPATECDRLYDITFPKTIDVGKAIMRGGNKNKVMGFTEDRNGGIWAATAGNGVYHLAGDTVSRITDIDGLYSRFCYSIFIDTTGILWVGHERGFSRLDTKTGSIKAVTTDFAKGGDCNPNAIIESDGKILIGTTEGLIIYDRSRDKKVSLPPFNNITGITINNKPWPIRNHYSLPYKKYTIRIDYVGISLSDPEKVLYKTRIDNINEDWSEFKKSRSIEYPFSDGKYRFNLISVGENGLSRETPLTFDIVIKKPYWRTVWFGFIVLLALSGIVILIVRERDKAQKKIKEYLETELAARTRLVMKQKDEIEMQNIEITDSINYAKRIQSSILPDMARLKETFSDAFILFHPRDIVSGDFYWFDKINDEKFIVVCADSTGHGVPGAFMSMIGSTLLQDIISRKGITKPSQVLSMLDKQIFSTLNQNIDVGVSNDGMDMVVCEINVKTKFVRFASAMRPVIIVMGGESYYIKGNRCSVGGESVIEKFFDDQEYYLSEGDSIYMFSDGFPDQFGGADGKKMKIARMKKMIEEVNTLPMVQQKQMISDFYFEWKGDYEQVDDILLMGLRL
ncbi:MAG: two-component regulator propeller domain-containing protein [Bacteroidales bacterium]